MIRPERSRIHSLDDSTPPQRKLRIILEYDGSSYCGWQWQDGPPSLQRSVELALEKVLGHPARTVCAGRTDTGVHALGQTISLATTSTLPHRAILILLNRHLPADISALAVHEAPLTFDARRQAQSRHYRFHLLRRTSRSAIAPRMVTVVPPELDLDAMGAAAALLHGNHDFSAFRSSACQAKRTRLDMQPIHITSQDQATLLVDVSCRSFLHNMVRILTGTMLAHARGRLSLDDIRAMLETGQRHHEAVTISPNGLFLRHVDYLPEILAQPGAHVSFPLDHPSRSGGAIPSCVII